MKQPPRFFSVLVLAVFLLSHPVYSDDEEDNLLQGLNTFRKSVSLPEFVKNKNAHCLANKIAGDLDGDSNQPCTNPSSSRVSNGTKLSDYPKAISKCNINSNTTSDVVVLPVCVPNLVPTLVLTNFTLTRYYRFVNDSRFAEIGLGSEDDWMVVVLSFNTTTGRLVSLANGAYSYGKHGLSYYMLFLLLAVVIRLNLV
ncbi:hypothetical protein like AT1G54860 [Hibiscus trionum]|uniref:Uncharacterized GPI-anchored protein At5g19230-like domain-containing protein n=1 Tax=Hibiscus trionum TaxID=183268 RepID=A0A9W7HVA7_HIBTR|nr:hypothetical protein like AT1G54860 [Hibiscus trionum]